MSWLGVTVQSYILLFSLVCSGVAQWMYSFSWLVQEFFISETPSIEICPLTHIWTFKMSTPDDSIQFSLQWWLLKKEICWVTASDIWQPPILCSFWGNFAQVSLAHFSCSSQSHLSLGEWNFWERSNQPYHLVSWGTLSLAGRRDGDEGGPQKQSDTNL